jgi:NAD(P)-dependent dehydrogenase (short-subunit alcohol dehydrogenase family)
LLYRTAADHRGTVSLYVLTAASTSRNIYINPTYDFKGQVALVTGASSGMGLEIAKAFADASAVDRTVTEFGRLDMAYNNAAILGPMCEMFAESADGYDEVLAVNLRGIWTFMKHELLQMKKQGSGAIVN